jgi:hypothetical protein
LFCVIKNKHNYIGREWPHSFLIDFETVIIFSLTKSNVILHIKQDDDEWRSCDVALGRL